MKLRTAVRRLIKFLLGLVLALILLGVGVVVSLYSPWMQRMLVDGLNRASIGTMALRVDRFELRPPLRLKVEGLKIITDGDTMLTAANASVRVSPLPLLAGRLRLNPATLLDARIKVGAPDSATYMVISADSLRLAPATLALPTMDIDIDKGSISDARVAMLMNPTPPSADTTAMTDMRIRIGAIDLHRLAFEMRMLPTIDSLGAYFTAATLRGGDIDLRKQTISLGSLTGCGLRASYITPDAATIAATPVYPADTTKTSEPWTVKIDTIGFAGGEALYTTRGVVPQPGLDFAYIQVSIDTLGVKDFYNQETTVVLPIHLKARERCGVALDARGTVRTSATDLRLDSFTVALPDYGSVLGFSAMMGMGDMMSDPTLPVAIEATGSIAAGALRQMFPAFAPMLAGLPAASPIKLDADAAGTMGNLSVKKLGLRVNHVVTLTAAGLVVNVTDLNNIDGHLRLDGYIFDSNMLRRAVHAMSPDGSLQIPPMTMHGNVTMHRGVIDGNLRALTLGGDLGLDAVWNSRHNDYTVDLKTDKFPVQAFMPLLGVGAVTATLTADGHGYNPFDNATTATAHLDVASAMYRDTEFTDISADLELADGNARISIASEMEAAEFTIDAAGNLDSMPYSWQLSLDSENIDLKKLGFSTEPCSIVANIDAEADYTPIANTMGDIGARLTVHSLDFNGSLGLISVDDLVARLDADTTATNFTLNNHDLYTSFSSDCGLDSLISGFERASALFSEQIEQRNIKVDTLRRSLPPFVLDLNAGNDNVITEILASRDMSFRRLSVSARNDSLLKLDADMMQLRMGQTRLDTITFTANQRRDNLVFRGAIGNRPGTLDEWARVDMHGFLRTDHVGLMLSQHNISGEQGYNIGLRAGLADSVATLSIRPYDPIIGYKKWSVNPDNFISYCLTDGHVDANLHMTGDDSSLAIFTEHDHEHDHEADSQEDLIVQLSDIHLQDWIAINPFAPPIKGDVGADLRLNRHENILNGNGSVTVDNLFYGRQRVGSFKADLAVETDVAGSLNANADLYVDSLKAVTITGALRPPKAQADTLTTEPMKLGMVVDRFPLAVANPFLPTGTATLKGRLSGSMDLTGNLEKPLINGWLEFDSTAVRLTMTGTDYGFSNVRIPVDDNVVKFNDFAINGVNANPLTVNGTVNLKRPTHPSMDLRLHASNMQLVNSSRARRGADVYGKAFIDLDATARGNLSVMMVNASLTLLAGTNVTYVMPDAVNTITQRSSGQMVKFVNLADSLDVARADSISENTMALFVNAILNIQNGSSVAVDLSTDGKNKVQIQPSGSLNYTLSPVTTDGRLSGRLNINSGFARYTMPPLSEKLFNFEPDSYVAFNGVIMNPTLNIHAYDDVRANVTQTGQNSRLVDFDVKLAVTGTLENMKVDFDLTTDNDITVANELQSMSPEQRANQAMNLLLYGVYSGPNTTGNAAIGGNMLYSFLESQLNSWAANNLHGIDLSFGINQYDRTRDGQTSLTTTYSYQLSKSLFDDRFKIVVGGNYSTDANADENFSQNLINDISFEYFLNKQHTMYVRLFRHTGFESILEGEVTQTGVGFVYKRRLRRLGDIFKFIHKKQDNDKEEPTQ